ncbi:MAG: hypothetical protein IPL91_01970 [Hyphomicrobium sp.]|nr:hypothetical protein [Hyphomicrobium sp.]
MASDLAAKLPVLRHAVTTAEAHAALTFDTVVDLQPTSPLRRPEDIPGAIAQLEANPQFENVVSVCAAADSPYYTLVEMSPAGVATLSKVPPVAPAGATSGHSIGLALERLYLCLETRRAMAERAGCDRRNRNMGHA